MECRKYNKVIVDECALGFYNFVKARVDEISKPSRGESDDNVVHIAEQTGALIITADKGFNSYPYENIIIIQNNGHSEEDAYQLLENILTKNKLTEVVEKKNSNGNNKRNGKGNRDIFNRYKNNVSCFR